LTLSTRHQDDDLLLLSTYLHEQAHWWLEAQGPEGRAALAELAVRYPDLPVGFPDGADSPQSSLEHLVVIAAEWRALRKLVGELQARQVMEFWATDHYRKLYRLLLEDDGPVREVLQRHGLRFRRG
jgi:hypothetical protein